MKHKHPTQKVPVGTPVWFLQFGQEGDTPLPATVVAITENLVCRLQILTPDAIAEPRLAVYPLGHKSLVGPGGAPSENARRNGAWTYHPLFTPEEAPPEIDPIETEEDPALGMSERQAAVIRLFEQYGSESEVFKRLRTKGYTKAEISSILDAAAI